MLLVPAGCRLLSVLRSDTSSAAVISGKHSSINNHLEAIKASEIRFVLILLSSKVTLK